MHVMAAAHDRQLLHPKHDMSRRQPSAFRYRRVSTGLYQAYIREGNHYLGLIDRGGTDAHPWIAEVLLPPTTPPDWNSPPQQRRVIGPTRDAVARIMRRYWLDYPQYRLPDPRDGRADDIPLPEEPQ